MIDCGLENVCYVATYFFYILAASPRRRGITVASRLCLCIFIKRGNSTSRFATVLPTWRPREPLTAKDRLGVICRVTVAKRLLPHFVKYEESQSSRNDCCAVTVATRLLPNFVKYAKTKRLLCCADEA